MTSELELLIKEYKFGSKFLKSLKNKAKKVKNEYELTQDDGVKLVYNCILKRIKNSEKRLKNQKEEILNAVATIYYF